MYSNHVITRNHHSSSVFNHVPCNLQQVGEQSALLGACAKSGRSAQSRTSHPGVQARIPGFDDLGIASAAKVREENEESSKRMWNLN